jgi:hypothetical protein
MKGESKDPPKDGAGQGRDDGGQGTGDKGSQAKGGGPDAKMPDQAPQAKGGADAGPDRPSAQSKPAGEAPKGEPNGPPQGVAKAEDAMGPPSLSKEKGPPTDKQSNDPRLKAAAEMQDTGEMIGAGKGEGKPPDGSAKEGPGTTRGDDQTAKNDAKPAEPTPQDVDHLKELMKRKDGLSDLAARELSKMARDAADPKVRELAKKALDQAGRKPPEPTPQEVDRLKDLLERQDGISQLAARELRDIADRAPDPKIRDQAKQALDKNWNDVLKKMAEKSKTASGADNNPKPGANAGDDGKGDPARKDLSRFGGNLQLEDFIKRATPAYREKAGISDDDWQRLLSRAADYDALLRKLQKQARGKGPMEARGAGGVLSGAGPSQVQGTPGAEPPLNAGQGTTPADLLDPQRRLRELRPMP